MCFCVIREYIGQAHFVVANKYKKKKEKKKACLFCFHLRGCDGLTCVIRKWDDICKFRVLISIGMVCKTISIFWNKSTNYEKWVTSQWW